MQVDEGGLGRGRDHACRHDDDDDAEYFPSGGREIASKTTVSSVFSRPAGMIMHPWGMMHAPDFTPAAPSILLSAIDHGSSLNIPLYYDINITVLKGER
jgi:hypothetical protein